MAIFINFKELRAQLDFARVLSHYGVKKHTVRDQQLSAVCPLPTHTAAGSKASFSADLARGVWRCFGCKASGNLLDFAVRMEGLDPDSGDDVRHVALRLRELFLVETSRAAKTEPPVSEPIASDSTVVVNAPLGFELKGLDANHPFFQQHGFRRETIDHFGAGFCSRGMLKGYIAIPLHDVDGQLVGYVGRQMAVDGKSVPREALYRYPESRDHAGIHHRFDLTRLVYNAHRIERPATKLFVADDYLLVWHLWELGVPAVAVMNSPSTEAQTETMRGLTEDGATIFVKDANVK